MKRVRKRLSELTNEILSGKALPKEVCDAHQSELKMLRELVATHKAVSAYEEEYGDEFEESGETKQKRTSDSQWD